MFLDFSQLPAATLTLRSARILIQPHLPRHLLETNGEALAKGSDLEIGSFVDEIGPQSCLIVVELELGFLFLLNLGVFFVLIVIMTTRTPLLPLGSLLRINGRHTNQIHWFLGRILIRKQ